MKENIIGAIAVLGLLVGVWAVATAPKDLVSNGPSSFGSTAAGGMLAENYIPYVLYNGGYNSAKDLNTSAFLGTTGTFQVSSSGTTFSRLNGGTCLLALGNVPASFTASTSVNVDCQASNQLATSATAQSALTGVTAGDRVIVMAPTTTPITAGYSVQLIGCNASSTVGYITCKLSNQTGATFTPGTTTIAGWQYFVTN